jgi:prevent-host-death family protein
MDIGVRDLKQRLSEFLDRAERGEIIRVTDRGTPKALIMPVPGRARLTEGLEQGWIRGREDLPATRVKRASAKRRSTEVLDEDREA